MPLLEVFSRERIVLGTEHVLLDLVQSKLVAAVQEHPLRLLVPHLVKLVVQILYHVLGLDSRLEDDQLALGHLVFLLLVNGVVRQVVILLVSVLLCLLFRIFNVGLLNDHSGKVLGQIVLVLFAYCRLSVSIPIAPGLLLPAFDKLFVCLLILQLIVLGSIYLKASLDESFVSL